MNTSTFSWPDVIRSAILVQSVQLIIFGFIYEFLVFKFLKLRPGANLGVLLQVISQIAAAGMVFLCVQERFGQDISEHSLLAALTVFAGSLGSILLSIHVVFHDEKILTKIGEWFHLDIKKKETNKR